MTDAVTQQYEAYPYPARDPREEKRRLVTGSPSNLLELNHYLFSGRRDFAKPFRALVAGGGTGDAAIMLAQQLAEARSGSSNSGGGGEVTYLDLSQRAREIAEARAAVRGLDNIRFVTGSLLAPPSEVAGTFDYIDCCGVLHHLPDPQAGLTALAKLLAPEGGMGLMLYGRYGRRGVYETQALLKQLAGDLPLAEQVKLARRLLETLPASNWLRRNPFLGDHRRSDAELVDLLLHARDRAFEVGELAEMVAKAGLKLVAFIEPARYDPASYLKDARLLQAAKDLDPVARAAMAEKLAGNIKAHIFYVTSATGETVAKIAPDAVPCLREVEAAALAKAAQRDLTLKADFDGLALRLPLPRLAPAILARIDGNRSLAAIHAELHALDSGLDWDRFRTQFTQAYAALNGINRLFLRAPAAS